MAAAGHACALGTASDTALVTTSSLSVYNATATTVTGSTTQTVRGVFGFATSSFTEQTAQSAAAGATATYDFAVQYTGNATDTMSVDVGVQAFGGSAGTATAWSVAAEQVGVGFVNFTTSGGATASQAGDTAPLSGIAPDATATVRLHNKIAGDAADASNSSYSVTLRTTNYPGAPYYGYNGTLYAGATTWARQLDGGVVITTVNGVQIDATKTFAVAAPAAYVTAGGGAADAVPGSSLNYTLTFSNSGAQAANTVVILDILPADTTYAAGSIMSCFSGAACVPTADPDANGADPDCYSIGGPVTQIQCDIAILSAGGGGQVTYKVTID